MEYIVIYIGWNHHGVQSVELEGAFKTADAAKKAAEKEVGRPLEWQGEETPWGARFDADLDGGTTVSIRSLA